MEENASSHRSSALYLVAAAVLWGFNGTLTKLIVWEGLTCAILRGCLTFFLLLIFVPRKLWQIRYNRYKVLCGLCYCAEGLLLIVSMKYTTAANATVLQNTSPVFIMLFNLLFWHILPRKTDILLCLVLFLGIVLTFAGSLAQGGTRGNVLACLAAVFYAGVFFFSRHSAVDDAVEPIIIGNAMYLLLLPLCFRDPAFLSPTLSSWAGQAALSLCGGFGAWMCFSQGIRYTPALAANFITMLEPITSAAIAFIVLGEAPDTLSLIGCGIVIVALLVYEIRGGDRGESV